MKKLIFLLQLITIFLLASKSSAQTFDSQAFNISLRTVTANSGLVLREKPNTMSAKLALIPNGEKVQVGYVPEDGSHEIIEGIRGNWVIANYRGKTGYLFDGFLSEAPVYSLFFDPEMHLPSDAEAPFAALVPQQLGVSGYQNFKMKSVNWDTSAWYELNGKRYYHELDVGDEDYPSYLFTGLDLSTRNLEAYEFNYEQSALHPGSMKTVHFGSQQYLVYATGDVIPSKPEEGNWKKMSIRNYQVFIEKVGEDASERQVIFSKKEIPISAWSAEGLANVRFVGDLDGDGLPDLILENYYEGGFESQLFLSSEADSNFLLKLVYVLEGSCC